MRRWVGRNMEAKGLRAKDREPRVQRERHGAMKMKALVKAKAEPGIWLEDVPLPEIGINDVLIQINKTSICGTDVHIYNWDAWARKTLNPVILFPVRGTWSVVAAATVWPVGAICA